MTHTLPATAIEAASPVLMGGGGRYLAVSRLVPDESTDVSFVIVEMGSRNALGQRFRSNRLSPFYDIDETAPWGNDGVVVTVPHEPGFTHAGGMQALGNVLAVPFEKEDSRSMVVFYDVSNPLQPTRLSNAVEHTPLSDQAGTATLGKLADGRFLLVIGRAAAQVLDFYVSTGTDLRTTGYEWFDRWDAHELTGIDSDFGDYQALNLVAQCDGTFFLVGTHRNNDNFKDFVDLFRVTNGSGDNIAIAKVAKKHLTCGDYCNLDAAGGVYVDPAGQLYLYSTPHDNDGPTATDPDCSNEAACSTEFAEFRPIPHASCERIEDAWVELYADAEFGGRSLMIDFVDRDRENYSNFDDAEDFGDVASGVRWCLPERAVFRLWENSDSCGGNYLDLVGDGALHNIPDLNSVGFGDTASCAEWRGGPFARAGADRIAECSGATTPVPLDGSASITFNSTPLEFLWAPLVGGITFNDAHSATTIGHFPLGVSPLFLVVLDPPAADTDPISVSVVDTLAPTISCPADIVVNATMPTGAEVAYNPSASDSCGAPQIACVAASGSVFAAGTNPVQCTATDQAALAASCQFTVTVRSAAEQIPDLIDDVNASALPAGTKNSLVVKLEAALAHLNASNLNAACAKLKDFIVGVQNLADQEGAEPVRSTGSHRRCRPHSSRGGMFVTHI